MKIGRTVAVLGPAVALGVVGTLLGLLLAGRSTTSAAATMTAMSSAPTTATICGDEARTASYAMGYDSVAALTRGATLIVVGTVSGVERVTEAGPPDFAVTDFQVTVETTLLSRVHGEGTPTITVRQDGGTIGCRHYVNLDDRLMSVGERDVFFLRQVAPGTYITLGPQGRFLVTGGEVRPANTMGPALPANETLTDVEAQVTGLRASVTERSRAASI